MRGLEEEPRKGAKFREMVLGVKFMSVLGLEQFSPPITLLSIPCVLWTNPISRAFVDFAVLAGVGVHDLNHRIHRRTQNRSDGGT